VGEASFLSCLTLPRAGKLPAQWPAGGVGPCGTGAGEGKHGGSVAGGAGALAPQRWSQGGPGLLPLELEPRGHGGEPRGVSGVIDHWVETEGRAKWSSCAMGGGGKRKEWWRGFSSCPT
jgi:hypothetical protein